MVQDERLVFIRHNFRYIRNFLRFYRVSRLDAVFADLGVSSHDFDVAERGFSFRFDGDLDMRMNRKSKIDAAYVINNYAEDRLVMIFKLYGEIKNARLLVSEILAERNRNPIRTTSRLKEIASRCAPRAVENKYLAQVFQALRIEVNEEMDALKEFMEASLELLRPGGRLAVITYHSLEDRICKNFMKTGNVEGKMKKDFYGNLQVPLRLVNRKVITPQPGELEKNTRARSAKLRIAEKL